MWRPHNKAYCALQWEEPPQKAACLSRYSPLTIRESPCAANKTQHSQKKNKRKESLKAESNHQLGAMWALSGHLMKDHTRTCLGTSFILAQMNPIFTKAGCSPHGNGATAKAKRNKALTDLNLLWVIQIRSELISFLENTCCWVFSCKFQTKIQPTLV